MNDTEKLDDSIYYEKVPGSGGIFSTIFFAIFGSIVIVMTLCYATNFICDFAGIDFDAFIWLRQFIYDLPELLESWIETGKGLIDSIMGAAE